MFYSHQLLARKAPLGQIWMAATMHSKINRKNLYKLNLIRICEEILNPSVPMALRLSGILMGGVVIVYERKVKLLYDDVTRLLVEINQAWKIKGVSEPASVSKKTRTKRETVSRSRNEEETFGEIEQPLPRSDTIDFMQTTFVSMRLDNLEDPVINQEQVEDPPQDKHQVDADNITLFDSFQPDANVFNHFERFDIEGDDDTQMHFTSLENPDIQPTVISSPPVVPSPPVIPSPPVHENPQEPEVIIEQHPEVQENQESDQSNKAVPDRVRRGPTRKRARKQATVELLDYEQIIIPGHVYQSWLQNTTDITSRRKKKKHLDTLPTRKLSNLMELPPLVLAEKLFQNGTGMIHYPVQLLDLWMKSTRPLPHETSSGNSSTPPPPPASSTSPVARANVQVPSENFQGHPVENLRRNHTEDFMPPEILMEDLNNHAQPFDFPVLDTDGLDAKMANLMTTPGNSGDELRSIPSSGSGPGFPSHNSDVDSGRSKKKRPFSSSKHSGGSLEPVEEENTWRHQDPVFKLAKLTEDGLAVENEVLVETGPTQTQVPPIIPQPMDQITRCIKAQLKSHFDAPGCPQAESLNQLTYGMDRKRAACLFYTTCVLANQQCIKVFQKEPYGDILISRGTKM